MFQLELTEGAVSDLRFLKRSEQAFLLEVMEQQLPQQPLAATRNRKQLRHNQLAEWELRVREFRVFYDVDGDRNVVRVKAVGRKDRNRLLIRGKEYQL